ncbi:MerR family transcriptional regulator [Rossellomorea aquimaris]|uniref:MerR family transcriptional regulator n=1 Tax=Rossellomorea aquimaris TaxID=189382 RepID=UPI002493FBCC|nr:MerR family transcriptional regulator [Rossellomorea aquimaris]
MYQISEVSALVGLSIPTIRYYEKLGLVEIPSKDERGYKVYDEKSVQYLGFIVNLKATDMPLNRIKEYVDAYKAGDHATCFHILKQHSEEIELDIEKRQEILRQVQYKVAHFSKLKGGGK